MTSSSSSFFSFFGPPPNIEKTLSLTAVVAVAAAFVTVSVTELAGLSSCLLSVAPVVTFSVSSLTRVGPGAAPAGSGFGAPESAMAKWVWGIDVL